MRRTPAIFVFLLVGMAAARGQIVMEQEKAEGFVPLFNGADLVGWLPNPAPVWKIEGGVLSCTGDKGDWLRTEQQFENFILRLEYKISPEGNSGVFIRCPLTGRWSRTGMEIQILDDHGKPPGRSSSGSIYDVRAPNKNMSRPAGEWNEVEITCRDRQIKVVINGETVHNVCLDDPALNPTEIPEQYKGKKPNDIPGYIQSPLAKRARKGHIALQNHSSPVWFRNIRIKVLD
ncbi:MAG: DUF1080 domain-containing protein [Planctomycetota bacterium]